MLTRKGVAFRHQRGSADLDCGFAAGLGSSSFLIFNSFVFVFVFAVLLSQIKNCGGTL
jgi:hypothetical protein